MWYSSFRYGDFVPISGKEMLKKYLENGWIVLRQKGSHVILGKDSLRETIPMHRELKTGLEKALIKRLKKGYNVL